MVDFVLQNGREKKHREKYEKNKIEPINEDLLQSNLFVRHRTMFRGHLILLPSYSTISVLEANRIFLGHRNTCAPSSTEYFVELNPMALMLHIPVNTMKVTSGDKRLEIIENSSSSPPLTVSK